MVGVGGYIKRGAESREARCHVKTLLMKRRQMSAVSPRSARRVGLRGGIVNTEGVRAIVTTFFPSAQPTTRRAIRGTRSAWNGIVTAAEHQDQQPINRAASLAQNQMGADKWSFRRPQGFYSESTTRGGVERWGHKSQLFVFHRAVVIYSVRHNTRAAGRNTHKLWLFRYIFTSTTIPCF